MIINQYSKIGTRISLWSVSIALIGLSYMCTPIVSNATITSISIGVFPRREATLTHKLFKPIAQYLSEQLGLEVKIQTSKNFNSFWIDLKAGKYDLVHYNQLHYIQSQKYGYSAIASNEEIGKRTIAGAFAVRNDSNINDVADLRGKTIYIGGGKKAMISYIVNVNTLQKAGLNPGDYEIKFVKNPPKATLMTYYNKADAAGIGDVGLSVPILKNMRVNVSELKLIGISEQLPHLPWAANIKLGPELISLIQNLLLDLNNSQEGRSILGNAGLTGLHLASDDDYDIHRAIYYNFKANQ